MQKELPPSLGKAENISDEVSLELEHPIPSESLRKILSNPWYMQRVYFGLCFFRKKNENPFAKDEFLEVGQEFYISLPLIEKEEKSLYQFSELQITESEAYSKLKIINGSTNAPSNGALITISYSLNKSNGKPKLAFSVHEEVQAKPQFAKIGREINKQVLRRIKGLGSDENSHIFKSYMIAGNLSIAKSSEKYLEASWSCLSAEFSINQTSGDIVALCNLSTFVQSILPHSDVQAKEAQPIKLGQTFNTTLGNMKASLSGLEPINEQVTFEIKRCDTNKIELISNENIANFYQYGILIEILGSNDLEKANIKISILYQNSSLVSVAKTLQKWTPTFLTPKAMPELDSLLEIRMRNFLDFLIRHTCEYFYTNISKEKQPTLSLKL